MRAAGEAFVGRKGIELDRVMAGTKDCADFRDHAFAACELALIGMGIDEDVVAHRPAQHS